MTICMTTIRVAARKASRINSNHPTISNRKNPAEKVRVKARGKSHRPSSVKASQKVKRPSKNKAPATNRKLKV